MSDRKFDVIVVGMGAMGSAAVYQIAKRGGDVLGIEQFEVPHTNGSYHGETRIIRKAYFEGEEYLPLLLRSYELWEELEEEVGDNILHKTGIVVAGPSKDNKAVKGAREACEAYDISYEQLSGDEVNARFPAYDLPSSFAAIYEEDGGFLECEKCVVAHVEQAEENGAEIRTGEKIINWESNSSGVKVETDQGKYRTEELVIAGGAWVPDLVPAIAEHLTINLYDLAWIEPANDRIFQPDNFPVFIIRLEEDEIDEKEFYGFPQHEIPGFKSGRMEARKTDVDPETVDRQPEEGDDEVFQEFAEEYFEDVGETERMRRCLVTYTPDEDFIIDTLPGHPNVTVAAGFSGHGFKMSSVVGEILADLSLEGETSHPIEPFRISRLG